MRQVEQLDREGKRAAHTWPAAQHARHAAGTLAGYDAKQRPGRGVTSAPLEERLGGPHEAGGQESWECGATEDRAPHCAALVRTLGCDARMAEGAVRTLCARACCDEEGAARALPRISAPIELGFGFPFYDRSVTQLRVTHLGLVQLDPASPTWGVHDGCCTSQPLPLPLPSPGANASNAAHSALIAPLWEDVSTDPPSTLCNQSRVAHSRGSCSGHVGDECWFVCERGYRRHGAHVCGIDGGFRGGVCVAGMKATYNSGPPLYLCSRIPIK